MRKRYLVLGLIVVLAAGWLGYSTYVFNLERFQPAQQTVVMTSDTVGAGGTATAHVRVVGRKTNAPLTGAHVTIYRVSNGDREKVAEGETGTAGNFSTTYRVPNRTGDYTLRVVTSSSKGRDAVTTSIKATRDYQIFVDTDKPVYKPGQDMTVRALVQHRQTGRPMTDTATAIVEGPKGNQLLKRNISLNSYGMGQLTFPISEAGRKGRYRVEVRYRGEKQVKTVNVREYRLPRFEVSLDPAKEYYRPGETFTATINAQYFFGKPVTDAKVRVVGEGYIGSLTRFDTVTTTTNDNGIATVS
ncbi:MAG: MG2 domain-containing protein, partial [Candidatus Nanohaloarchaea archaeon]|nr:MG2 domain-containing protein [Candidatus Nanohaloarchaea archaeon]